MTYIRSRVFNHFFLSFFLAIHEGKNYFIVTFFRSSCEWLQLIVPFGPGGPCFPGGLGGPALPLPVFCICCPKTSTRLYYQQIIGTNLPADCVELLAIFSLIDSNSSSVFRLQQSLVLYNICSTLCEAIFLLLF